MYDLGVSAMDLISVTLNGMTLFSDVISKTAHSLSGQIFGILNDLCYNLPSAELFCILKRHVYGH